jgi:hypothetical protein
MRFFLDMISEAIYNLSMKKKKPYRHPYLIRLTRADMERIEKIVRLDPDIFTASGAIRKALDVYASVVKPGRKREV